MTTGPGLTRRALAIFEAVVDLPADERVAQLADRCAGDQALFDRVTDMLESDAAEDLTLDQPAAAPEVLPAIQVPPQVGPYRIVDLIGAGGMGSVYRAERSDGAFERTVAIKFIQSAFSAPSVRGRFEVERQVMARLEHPAITQLLDGGEINGQPYLVMEFVDGEPFGYRAETDRDEVLQQFLAVCDALVHAHAQLVLHRDIKPQNILINRDGAPKLLDFGVAKLVETLVDEPAGLTQLAGLPITPSYTAPECLNGSPASVSSDVYALGVLLQEILTNTKPRELSGKTLYEIHQIISHEPPQAPATGDPDLDLIILTALHPDLSRRYPTVQSLAEDLRRFLRREPLTARADDRLYVLKRFVQRHRRAVVASTLGLTALIASLTGTSLALFESEQSRQLAEQQIQTANAAVGFLERTLAGANPLEGLQPLSTIDEALELASSNLTDQLDMDDGARAYLHAALSNIYLGRGNTDMVFKNINEAQALMSRDRSAVRNEAQVRAMVAQSLFGVARFDQALTEANRAINTLQDGRDPDALVPHVTSIKVDALVGLGRWEEAIDAGIELIDRFSNGSYEDRVPLARVYNGLSNAYMQSGEVESALTAIDRSIDVLIEAAGPDDSNVFRTRINRATVLSNLGRVDEAEDEYRSTIAEMTEALGQDHEWVLWASSGLAVLLNGKGTPEAAVALLAPLEAIVDEKYKTTDPPWPLFKAKLGYARCLSDDVETGLRNLRNALIANRALYAADNWLIPDAEAAVGFCLIKLGRYDEAESALLNAERDFVSAFGEQHRTVSMTRNWLADARAERQSN
ncbi:MAG: protein kinase [Pseudomonadota bacterium]